MVNIPITITNLITNEVIDVNENTFTLVNPLFNNSQYKIKVNIADSELVNYSFRKIVRWDFGDGTIVEGITAEHSYEKAGKYKISCTFYNITRTPIENEYTINVIVKEIVPLELRLSENDIKSEYSYVRSKISNIFQLESYVSSFIDVKPNILFSKVSDENEDYYYDIKETNFYHLNRYWVFLNENIDNSYKKETKKVTLTPTEVYKPNYIPLYIDFTIKDNKVLPLVYAYITNKNDIVPDTFNLYNPEMDVNVNHLEASEDYYISVPINKITYKEDIPSTANLCGWVGVTNIWYKDDYIGNKKLFFTYDINSMSYDVSKIDLAAINIPPLGITITINEPNGDENIIYALTPNGLLTEKIDNDVSSISIDNFLYYNFYKDYTVETYFARYIKNEIYDNNSWSLLKDETNITALNGTNCNIGDLEDNLTLPNYISHFTITPEGENFSVYSDRINKYFNYNEKLRDFENIIIPKPKYEEVSFRDVLKVYTPHPLFENTTNLTEFLCAIFETDDLFENLNMKSVMFLDNTTNHQTCYIEYLKALMQMFNVEDLGYDISALNKINDIKELLRILSMQYSLLFGQPIEVKQDIAIISDNKGKEVGDRIMPGDLIACDINYNIIGIIRNNIFYPANTYSPYLILFDTYTKNSRLVSFASVKDYTFITDYKVVNDIKLEKEPKYFYSLDDYNYQWGWCLNLPNEAESSTSKSNIIDAYYSLYLFNKNTNIEQKYNFLNENMFPLSFSGESTYITVDEWNAKFRFTYDCLMKVIIEKLNLYKLNEK